MITLRDLRKEYGAVTALDGVSLHIERATIHGIVGESGAGKSTLVRCLTGLERPTSGAIELAGQDLAALGETALRTARRTIGMVFQNVHLFDSRTALQNIAYPLRVVGVPKAEAIKRAQALLDLVGIGARGGAYPSQLSGGQRQRVGIARALMQQPRLLLADEPTSSLDPRTSIEIMDLLGELSRGQRIPVVINIHNVELARRCASRIIGMSRGEIVFDGGPEALDDRHLAAIYGGEGWLQ